MTSAAEQECITHDKDGCFCLAELGCSADELRQACLDWADDLRWSKRKVDGWPLVFRMYGRLNPWSWGAENPTVTVGVGARADNHVMVTFAVSNSGRAYSLREMGRVCMSFTRGVCSALASGGIVVVPPELGQPRQNGQRTARVARYRSYVDYLLLAVLIGIIVAYVVSCFLIWPDGYLPLIPLAFMVLTLLSMSGLLQLRLAGMRQLIPIIISPLIFVGMTVLSIVAFANS